MENDSQRRRATSKQRILWCAPLAGAIVALMAIAAVPRPLSAVSCPPLGAKVRVCVKNETSDTPTVFVAGSAVSNEITCTGPAPILGGYQANVLLGANQTTCSDLPGAPGGLVTGMYVHRIYYAPPPTPGPSPTPRAAQYQKGPVVWDGDANGANQNPVQIDWTYHKTVLTVNSIADSVCNDANCQAAPGTCTLRQAVERARQGPAERPVLINFNLPNPSTIELTQTGSTCGQLRLVTAAPIADMTNVTIDGTHPNGNPWIVGDRAAAAAGTQGPFPVTVDLKNQVRFQITKHGVTVKGLHVKKTVPVAMVQANEVFLIQNVPTTTGADIEIRATKIDGGNQFPCVGDASPCAGTSDLINLATSRNLIVNNVEGHSALDKGIKAFSGSVLSSAQVSNSWLHHNYRGNVQANGAGQISVSNSVVELAGRRYSDNLSVDKPTPEANGMVANQGRITSTGNIVERNRAHGIVLRQSNASATLDRDVACGNGNSGVIVEAVATSPTLNSDGVASVFNGQPGVRINAAVSTIDPFGPSHAFVNNVNTGNGCDFENTVTGMSNAVTVNDSQWTGGVPRKCGSGTVTVSSVQNHGATDLPETISTYPSNVLLAGQSVRAMLTPDMICPVENCAFNAVNGNTRVGVPNCMIGDDVSDQACCRRSPRESNTCDGMNQPPVGSGQCVQIRDRLGTWHTLRVDAVSPTMIVTSLPTDAGSIFPCLGGDAEIRVVKRRGGGLVTTLSPYCTNGDPATF